METFDDIVDELNLIIGTQWMDSIDYATQYCCHNCVVNEEVSSCAAKEMALDIIRRAKKIVEKWYFARPLFDDGYPVQFGDKFKVGDKLSEVDAIRYLADDNVILMSYDGLFKSYAPGEKVERPAECRMSTNLVKLDENTYACANCGSDEVWPWDKYCRNCGRKLKDE